MLTAEVAAALALRLRLPFVLGAAAARVVWWGVMPDWWMRSALMRLKIRCIAGRTNTSSSMKKR